MGDKQEDRLVPFKGAKLSTHQANKVGLGLVFGFAGALVSLLLLGSGAKTMAGLLILLFAALGYFVLGDRVFKR